MIVELARDLSEIHRLAEAVEGWCDAEGVPMDAAMQLNLALDELITNTISYGYDGAPDKPHIAVRLDREADWLTVVLEDDARPFDPLSRPPPDTEAALEDREIGGLGIHFVRSFMDEVAYRRDGDRNILTLRKKIA
ncbi:MAG TPA: ATP-binding protein [Azospirillaceae bacterium]|nr:ATP-binding protein [Azospirillaceae bacterium]